jgi:hypothetical protein
VPEVQVGLGAIVCYEYFTVLVGAHRSRIDVEIGSNLQRHWNHGFQQPPMIAAALPCLKKKPLARYKDELGCHECSFNDEGVHSFEIFRCVHGQRLIRGYLQL